MQLDQNQLQKLLAFLAESDIQEFRLETDDFRIEVRRNLPNISSTCTPVTTFSSPIIPSSISPTPCPSVTNNGTLIEITAPMVGTFYRAPAPGEPTFVEIGSHIDIGQTVCILEAMKLMNELESEVSGQVMEILVSNGTPVEFGQVLMRVNPDSMK